MFFHKSSASNLMNQSILLFYEKLCKDLMHHHDSQQEPTVVFLTENQQHRPPSVVRLPFSFLFFIMHDAQNFALFRDGALKGTACPPPRHMTRSNPNQTCASNRSVPRTFELISEEDVNAKHVRRTTTTDHSYRYTNQYT